MADDLKQLRPNWDRVEALSPTHVNQFYAQTGLPVGNPMVPDGIYIGLGTLAPPVILENESGRERMANLEELTINPVIKVFVTRDRLTELLNVLQTAAQKYDAALEQKSPAPQNG